MISNAFQRVRSSDVPGPKPAGWPLRLFLVAAWFGTAFALDVLSDRQFSRILGSAAIFGSALTLFPAIRPGLIAASTCALTWVGFNLVRAFADDAGLGLAGRQTVADLERALFGGVLPSTRLQHQWLDPGSIHPHDIAFSVVHGSFFFVPFLIAAIAWWRQRPLFSRYLKATAICFAISLVAFALLPTAPPWMSDPDEVARITHQVLRDGLGTSALAEGSTSGEAFWFEPNDLAALPSVHVAMAVLVSLVLGTFARWGRVTGALYAVAMSVSVVYLGEHFVLDVVTGWIVAFAAWRLARPRTAPRLRA
ncbi:MAG TPA: phosphatase PAP2 family protein [Thermomicrobiales bacterium]|nr:phosphatase PAP2 family protein [Thermomicrobiales bacterium]